VAAHEAAAADQLVRLLVDEREGVVRAIVLRRLAGYELQESPGLLRSVRPERRVTGDLRVARVLVHGIVIIHGESTERQSSGLNDGLHDSSEHGTARVCLKPSPRTPLLPQNAQIR